MPSTTCVGPLDVIITTYNRPLSVARLVAEVQACAPCPARIIVVDSSDDENVALLVESARVSYIRARHKNQPYQRYVGLLASGSETVVMLDDDLVVKDFSFLGLLGESVERDGIVGSGVAFSSEGVEAPSLFPSSFGCIRGPLVRIRNGLRKPISAGTIDPAGRSGGMPSADGEVQYFPGAVMCFRREVALRLFDERLFSLFEARLGMGEDKAISMRATRFGKLYWCSRRCLEHPPAHTSTYADDPVAFLRKVLVSRYFLASVYGEARGRGRSSVMRHFLLELARMLGSGLLRGRLFAVIRSVVGALRVVLTTSLTAAALAPGVDFWSDAEADAGLLAEASQGQRL